MLDSNAFTFTTESFSVYFHFTEPPWGPGGFKSRMCPQYPQLDRKRRLNGAVCRNHRIKRVVPCRCLDGHVKEPYEMSMASGARPQDKLLLQSACTSMGRHIYDWNIVNCDVKQTIQQQQQHFTESRILMTPSHKLHHKQTKIMFQITKFTLSDGIFPIECNYIKIEDLLWPRQILRAVKVRAIWWGKEPCSFSMR